ncbi:MAG: N-methyl-L-tryptophan oxidase [Chthoniobacteraceae bacterium]
MERIPPADFTLGSRPLPHAVLTHAILRSRRHWRGRDGKRDCHARRHARPEGIGDRTAFHTQYAGQLPRRHPHPAPRPARGADLRAARPACGRALAGARGKVGTPIFHRIGSLDVSLPGSHIFQGSKRACAKFDLPHEVLDAAETTRRFPALTPTPEMMSVYQPGSGFVLPELAVSSHVNLALAHGAEIHGHERLLYWEPRGSSYIVRTNRNTYEAKQIVFSAGAWIGKLLAQFGVPVVPERTVLGWFAPKAQLANFQPAKLPVWIVDLPETGHFYGFPVHGIPGFKLGRLREIPSPAIDPDLPRHEANEEDEADMRSFISRAFPDANGPVLSMETCFFENTPDRAPIMDRLPGEQGAWVAGGFSGHGFKFCSAVGEAMTDLVTKGSSAFDLRPFALSRFNP